MSLFHWLLTPSTKKTKEGNKAKDGQSEAEGLWRVGFRPMIEIYCHLQARKHISGSADENHSLELMLNDIEHRVDLKL